MTNHDSIQCPHSIRRGDQGLLLPYLAYTPSSTTTGQDGEGVMIRR
jgi:hypothetical protein